jgi:Protein of unknown function (DUF667)
MFQNAFQSGPSVEVLYSCDKNPAWSINKSNWKFYEKAVKGFVVLIDSHNTKLTMPGSDKLTLALVQPYLVLQVFIMPAQPFTLEIAITDISNSKRRLVFSSASKDLTVNPLHARIPNSSFVRGAWANISIDLLHCVHACFTHNTFRSLDSIIISSFCKVRRVFTMRNPLVDTTGTDPKAEFAEQIPKNLDFPSGVQYLNQLITPETILPLTIDSIEVKNTPKKVTNRAPLTTAPLDKIKRPGLRTSSVSKKQGNTTTTFFQRKKDAMSPRVKDSINFSIPESPKKSGRINSSASNRYQGKVEEEKVSKDENFYENPLEVGDEEVRPNDFNHLTNYKEFDEVMSNSIEEEIEIDSGQQENNVYNPDSYVHPEHNYFPHEELEEEAPKPTFFSNGMNQATLYRPFTPPFAGLSSMKNVSLPDKENEEEAVELIYDPVLQCYYDPSTMEYYQVNE